MAGSRTALFALLILGLFALVDWLSQSTTDSLAHDADVVYCLAPAHQAGLVNAAVSLGLAGTRSSPSAMRVSRSAISLDTWRSRDDADFERACDAYAAPAFTSAGSADQGSGIGALLNVLLPVAAGALFALAIDEIKQGSDRRWAQADALRESWSAFRGMLETYVKERQQLPPDGVPAQSEIDALRRDLITRLRAIHSQHRKSRTVAWLKSQLAAELGTSITTGWAAGESQDMFRKRRERAAEITGTLENFDSLLQKVAEKLERRIWLSWRW